MIGWLLYATNIITSPYLQNYSHPISILALYCVSCRAQDTARRWEYFVSRIFMQHESSWFFRGKPIDATKLKRNNLYTCMDLFFCSRIVFFFSRSNFCKMVFHICCDVDGFYNLLFHRPNKFFNSFELVKKKYRKRKKQKKTKQKKTEKNRINGFLSHIFKID